MHCNLRPTTRECVHLVTRAHFRSRDKDGRHSISSAVAEEDAMLHASFMVVSFIESELLTGEDCGKGVYEPFCSCDLDLDPMTFIYEFDPYSLDMSRMCEYELPTSRHSIVIV